MSHFSLRAALGAEEQAQAITACLAGLLSSSLPSADRGTGYFYQHTETPLRPAEPLAYNPVAF